MTTLPGTAQDPLAARRKRIRDLEVLRDRIDAELATERLALRRTSRVRRLVEPAKVPEGIDPRSVRAWARRNGWPQLGTRGRIPGPAITAYLSGNPRSTP